jgi:hemolysin D
MLKDREVEIVKTNNSELKTTNPATAINQPGNTSQSVLFQQSKIWSRAIGWGIMGLIVAVITWASLAHIDEAIPADGKLEPLDDAKKIQAPMAGVVKQIYVKNGDKVQAGALLLRLESTIPQAQLTYLASTKQSLSAENHFYREQMNLKGGGKGKGEGVKGKGESEKRGLGETPSGAIFQDRVKVKGEGVKGNQDKVSSELKIAPEILALTQSRTALIAENQLYRAEMSGKGSASLSPEQQKRLDSSVNELNTRISAGKSEIGQVQKQLAENRVRRQGLIDQQAGIKSNITSINSEIGNSGNSLTTSLSQIDRQLSQNQAKISASQKTLSINQQMLTDLRPAGAAGAVARSQIDRQEQEVVNRGSELEQQIQEQSRLKLEQQRLTSTSQSDTQRQQQRIQEQQQLLKQNDSQISQLDQEYARLQFSANQSVAKLDNSKAVNQKDLFTRIADNDKRIAEIDSQLNKSLVENEKKITEISNQITQAQQSLKYQEIRSPVAGEVFELKAFKEGVVNSNSPDALVQIVPSKDAIAKVYITNKDIGFVKIGQQVDVRIDTFNFSEFGDVKGTIEWIGSDALPPDQIYPFARFPAKIKLSKQTLTVKGSAIQLKPGMSVKANIKLRDRTVMSIFTDMFSKQSDGVKNLR